MNFVSSGASRRKSPVFSYSRLALAIGGFVLLMAGAWAQFQTNPQIYGSSGVGGSIKYAALPNYGAGPTSELLPSEEKNLIYRSGALPSEVRMQIAELGPMLPAQQYIPTPGPTYQLAKPGPAPSYMATGAPSGFTVGRLQPIAPGASFGSFPSTGSVRYSSPMASAAAMPARSYSAAPVGGGPMGGAMPAGYRLSGSVRYGR